jgi:hypothetical protein
VQLDARGIATRMIPTDESDSFAFVEYEIGISDDSDVDRPDSRLYR